MNSFSPLRKIALTIVVLLLLFSGLYLQQIAGTGAQLLSETTTQATLRARQLTGSVADQIAILVRYIDFASQELAETYVEESASEFAANAPKIGQRFPAGSLMQIAVIDAKGYLSYSNLGFRSHFSSVTANTSRLTSIPRKTGSLSANLYSAESRNNGASSSRDR